MVSLSNKLFYKALENTTIIKHTINDLLEILGETQQFEGLHIHISKDKFVKIPLTYPFRTDNYVVIFVVSGNLTFQLNLLKFNIQKKESIIILPNIITQILEMSSKLEIIAVSFNLDFLLNNVYSKTEVATLNFLITKNIPTLKFNDKELKYFKTLAELLQSKSSSNILYQNEIILHAFNLFLYELATIYKKQIITEKVHFSRQEELSLRFFSILQENFKTERSVQFYADTLFVTPGYLSKVLKEVSGNTTSQLIDNIVIMEARILLANPSLTISQISDELQFSNQSFFGKFFKKHIGISLLKYRNSYL